MIINHFRTYMQDRTEGALYVNGVEYCSVLEDPRQEAGRKIIGETCVPEGLMQVKTSVSHKFKKNMLLLYNRADGSIHGDGRIFTGIRPHFGVHVGHTSGCPLLGFRLVVGRLSKPASDALFEMVDRALSVENVYWVISESI